jgi:hypothetical protein
MGSERRKYPRFEIEQRVEVTRVADAGAPGNSLPVYVRDKGPGGMSGTCFGETVPRVNELLFMHGENGGMVTMRVAWCFCAVQTVHMLGFEFLDKPVCS